MMRPAAADLVSAAVRRSTVWPIDLEPDPGFVSVQRLVADGLPDRICSRLGDPPRRVGVSAAVMGLAARLWSVTVVTAARDRILVDDAVIVASDDDGAVVLGLSEPRGWLDPTPDDVDAVAKRILAPVIAGLDLSPRLLWGNVAASLYAVPQVHDLPQARPLVTDLLGRTPYAGELEIVPGTPARRRSCCLFYLVPGAGLCGDCVFDQPPVQ